MGYSYEAVSCFQTLCVALRIIVKAGIMTILDGECVSFSGGMAKKKDPNAVSLGSKGGRARARRLSPEERRESARKAALARWRKKRPTS